jgi:translation elongation factor EF-Tu-like GTPase
MHRPLLPCLFTLLALLAACGRETPKQAPSGVLAFPRDTRIAARFTLMEALGHAGRAAPIGNGYRPQFRFAGQADDIACTVTLPAGQEALPPGRSADVSLACAADLRMDAGRLEFEVLEGGKKVGHGALRAP